MISFFKDFWQRFFARTYWEQVVGPNKALIGKGKLPRMENLVDGTYIFRYSKPVSILGQKRKKTLECSDISVTVFGKYGC